MRGGPAGTDGGVRRIGGALPLAFEYCRRKQELKFGETPPSVPGIRSSAEITVIGRFCDELPTVHDSGVGVGSAGRVGLQSLDLFDHFKARNDDAKDNVDSAQGVTTFFQHAKTIWGTLALSYLWDKRMEHISPSRQRNTPIKVRSHLGRSVSGKSSQDAPEGQSMAVAEP